MFNKPDKVPEIEKDKTLYTVDGYVDFTNWLYWMMSKQEVDTTDPEDPKLVARYV